MKANLFFVVIFFSFFLLTFTSNAQWIASNGLEGANISDITVLDSTIYFCGESGVYQKPIDGGDWTNNLYSGGYFFSIEETDTALFALGYYVFYRSLDYGLTWEEIVMEDMAIHSLQIIENKPIISNFYNILISDDLGDNWDTIPMYFTYYNINDFFVSDSVILVFYDNDKENQLCYTSNMGNQWISLSMDGLENSHINDFVIYHDSMFMATQQGVYFYKGFANGWEQINEGLTNTYIRDLEIINDTLYSTGKGGVFFLDDYTWINDSEGLEATPLSCITHYGNQKYCGGEWGPFNKEGANDWNGIFEGLNYLNIYNIYAHESVIWACTQRGVFKSDNLGVDFTVIENSNLNGCKQMVLTDSLYYLSSDSGLFLSYDFGETWSNISDNYIGNGYLAVGSDYIFYESDSGIFRIDHVNKNWELLPSWIAQEKYLSDISAKETSLFVSLYNSPEQTFLSTDNGNNFYSVLDVNLNHIEFYNDTIYATQRYVANMKKSVDGLQWDEFPFPNGMWSMNSLAVNDEVIVIGGDRITLYVLAVSYDGGLSWQDYSEGLIAYVKYPTIVSVEIYDNRIFAGSMDNGLWYRDDLLVGTVSNPQKEVDNILLYPNPATSLLTIEVTETGNVNGEIFIRDMHGKMLLQTNIKSAQTQLNIESLSPGIYILQFTSQDKNLTKKFLKQ